MPKGKQRPLIYAERGVDQLTLINRWNICQAIARLLYLRRITDDQLRELYNDHSARYAKERKV